MKSLTSKIAASLLALTGAGSLIALAQSPANNNIVDEIVWVVGDEAVFRSDIEEELQQLRAEGGSLPLNPYCVIPEQLAVQKLYLHQAKMDTIEAPEGQLNTQVDRRLDYFVAGLGSKEKVEQYFRKSFPELRNQLRDVMRTQYIIGQVQETLTKDVKATPSLVKKYFAALPVDSIPYVPLQVETQIIMVYPQVPQSEIDAIKDRLRDISERVNNGESDFSTQAIMYSEDGSAMQGGENSEESSAFLDEMDTLCASLAADSRLAAYGARHIAFLFFLPISGTSFTMAHYADDGDSFYYEYSCLYKTDAYTDGEAESPATYAHEILHLFGAPDLYEGSSDPYVDEALVSYVADTYPGDIMLSTYEDDGSSRFDAITKEISPLTAYCLGLTDTCPELAQFPLLADMTPGVFSYGADGEAGSAEAGESWPGAVAV